MRLLPLLGLALLLVHPAPVRGASYSLRQKLDTTTIHKIYVDGDFDQAIGLLEQAFTEDYTLSHQDSVFAFKHLGVMYAAKYETREKGKKYMMLLLQTEPTARIMDMYASDMIYMIFKNLQDEYTLSLAKMKRAKEHLAGNAEPEPPKKRSYTWAYWVGGVVVAAGGIVLAVHIVEEPETVTHARVIK